jgi:alpha-L-arabinofuranosidase
LRTLHSKLLIFTSIIALFSAGRAAAQSKSTASLVVEADKPGPRVSPSLFGTFFEEINLAGDGGLYGELIRNRSFEESTKPVHWKLVKEAAADAEMSIDSIYVLSEKNTHYLKLKVLLALEGYVGVANEGYWGIPVKKGVEYDLSLYAMTPDGINRSLTAVLEAPDERVLAQVAIDTLRSEWKQFKVTMVGVDDCPNARLVIRAMDPGVVFLDVVSLFPKKTFKARPNGMRKDLAGMLDDLKPSFVRFPGGCWVEGDNLGLSYRWKQTIGDVADRRYQFNIWQYWSTNGLGFHEYLQLCEDLRAEPLFVINVGMSHHGVVPMAEMKEWVQDALDAIEYANGPVDSRWGSKRAVNGHPAPFNLKYMEIGNENGGSEYAERYALFHDAIKAKYPDMHLIANVWDGYPKNRPVEFIDEHYYSSPEFFINNADRYDKYDRSGPAIYVGEYAVTQRCGKGNLLASLGEAAFMTGMERNADIVRLSSYAPLFANVNYKKWNPDLINFNASESYGTPSYYAQKMFSQNRGDVILRSSLKIHEPPPEPPPARNGKIGLGTWNTQAEFKEIEVTKNGERLLLSDFTQGAREWKPVAGKWNIVGEALQQTAEGIKLRAYAGDSLWTDYTYTLKARKLGGAEGFLILFSVKDNDNYAWWNIGGWGNTKHAVEYCEDGWRVMVGQEASESVETGRWYDIKIELSGQQIRCYLDGKLVHDVRYESTRLRSLHAVAGRDTSTGEIVLKVVNVSKHSFETQLDIRGTKPLDGVGSASILTSADPKDENSIEMPRKVIPRAEQVNGISNSFRYLFPAYSLTVLRLREKK